MNQRQHHNPLDLLTSSISNAGSPGAEGILDETRAHMDRLVAAADDAYNRLQADETDEFLRQGRQLGGQ